MKWKLSQSVAENARTRLPKLAEKYFLAGRKAAEQGEQSPKHMHRFRLETKRFRYSLELFRPVYGPSMDQHLQRLKDLQNVLGELSDSRSMLDLFEGDKSLEAKLQRSIKRKWKEFRQQWDRFDTDGQLDSWRNYLKHGAGRVRR